MTALAGIWSFGAGQGAEAECRAMLLAQRRFASGAPSISALGGAALGRSLSPLLAEDRFDRQPLAGAAGRLLVADLRLDNRDELLDRFGAPRSAELSDADLLLRAHDEWGEALFDHVFGDFAFALWDEPRQRLILARDPIGHRPLHYHRGRGFVAFASMPAGLHALDGLERTVDRRRMAGFIADIPESGSATFFAGIERVLPGHLVEITPDGARSRDYWRMPDRELRLPRPEDYVEALREQLDRATRSRLRGAETGVAAHLSGGLDSGAVMATAARQSGSVVALTAAPRPGFDGPAPAGRIADESKQAAAAASGYPNVEHVILRSAGRSPLDVLGEGFEAYQAPAGLPCNHVWWAAANAVAGERGIPVILTGEAGNLTLTSGGLALLSDLVRTGQWGRWWREARLQVASGGPRWRGVLAASFGPWLPHPLWSALNRLHSGHGGTSEGAALLHPDIRAEWEERLADQARSGRPDREGRATLWRVLRSLEMGNFKKGALARWQVDERDPTADRRLAEFCFSLPPEQLIGGGERRRLARLVLADRLPRSVLYGERGYQYADWYEGITRKRLLDEVEALGASPAVGVLFDLGRLRSLAETWPPGDWASPLVIARYRLALLRALSAGRFLVQTEG